MYILGDIGNTETKLWIVSKNNKISKKITFLSKSVNNRQLNILFRRNKIQLNKIEKILFCSVVPKTFSKINKFLSKKVKLKCYE
uniref:type III pantothenate kinase n=1 Tax=Pelagibacter ubique TaxID=198252 RepID=UPI000B2DEB4A